MYKQLDNGHVASSDAQIHTVHMALYGPCKSSSSRLNTPAHIIKEYIKNVFLGYNRLDK